MKTRIESDSMGELKVPEDALYGAQTQRAINNFPVSGKSMPEAFVRALLVAKSAAAAANTSLGLLAPNVGNAITGVVQELLQSPELMSHFPVDVYQTGSGTSSNMNANEVLATLASSKTGESVSANDHINYGQSSNDIIPTCIHISAAVEVRERLLPALEHLHEVILVKAKKVDHHIKTGRTHLMDAMPVRLSQSLLSWATQINKIFILSKQRYLNCKHSPKVELQLVLALMRILILRLNLIST